MASPLRACAALICALSFAAPASAATALRGYDAAASARERSFEARFLGIPAAANMIATTRVIGSRVHDPGSPGDYALALYMRDRLREDGFSATIETLRARRDQPYSLVLATQPAQGVGNGFQLSEVTATGYAISDIVDIQRPFNYGSGDGDMVAPAVYANRGLDKDYAVLSSAGVSVAGCIAVVRYGAEFPGALADRARRYGAAAVIFYSDPADDGSGRGPVFPNGPWRPPGSVERAMVSRNVIGIPTLPITAINAATLVGLISGPQGPPEWQGGLGLSYRVGKTSVPLHLAVRMQRYTSDMWNTIGVLPGRSKDSAVILGGHRDAWVLGATDNGSGISALLETARALGALYRHGWRPLRTIVIAGWDGEEIGQAGSRAYVATHRDDVRRGNVAYFDADEVAAGAKFTTDAVAALAPAVVEITHAVTAAGTSKPVFDAWPEKRPNAPGGGSDHEPFLFGLGIPTAAFDYVGPFGVYGSAFDDMRYATTQADPGFARHRAIAQLLGIAAMRIADAPAVPYAFSPYAGLMRKGSRGLVARSHTVHVKLQIAPLDQAIERYARAAPRFDARIVTATPGLDRRALEAVRDLDMTVYGAVGDRSVLFGEISAALETSNPFAANAAVKSAAAAVDRATRVLSSSSTS